MPPARKPAIHLATPWLLMAALAVMCAGAAWGQSDSRKPISREGLFKAVEIGGLSADELAGYVRELGVEFKLTAEDRQILAKAGVDRAVIEAVEANYRMPPQPPAEQEAKLRALSQGAALSASDVVQLLKAGNAASLVERVAERRGITFMVTPEIARDIESAGGNRQLLGVLVLGQPPLRPPRIEEPPRPQPASPPPPVAAPVPPQTANTPPQTTAPAAVQADSPEIAGPLRVAPAVQAARLLKQVKPEFPIAARRDRVGGLVRVELLIGEDGRVEKCRPLTGHPFLQSAAESAIRRWSYLPAVVDGKPVKVITEVDLNFRLTQ